MVCECLNKFVCMLKCVYVYMILVLYIYKFRYLCMFCKEFILNVIISNGEIVNDYF